jgi:hypothetical protein
LSDTIMAITAMRMARIAAALKKVAAAMPMLPAIQKLASLILEAVQRTVPLMYLSAPLLKKAAAGATPVNPTYVRKKHPPQLPVRGILLVDR